MSVEFIASVHCCWLAESNLKRFNHYYDSVKHPSSQTYSSLWNRLRIMDYPGLGNMRIERFLRIERFTEKDCGRADFDEPSIV